MASEAILQVRIDKWLLERAESAEAQLATERARHAAMAADYEKIATGTHPGYWMLEPGDVLFRPTETRRVRYGEWFRDVYGDLDCWDSRFESSDECKIYRRIDAPADAASVKSAAVLMFEKGLNDATKGNP